MEIQNKWPLLVFVISGWTYVKASQAINVLKVSLSMSACISTAYSLNSSNFCLKRIQFFEFFVFIHITVTSHHIYNLLHAKIRHHLCLILLIFCTLPLTTTLTLVAQFQSSFARSAEIFAKFLEIFTYKMYLYNMICLTFMHQPTRGFPSQACAHQKGQRAIQVFENLKEWFSGNGMIEVNTKKM